MTRTLARAMGSALLLSGLAADAQPTATRPPIIDVHLHALTMAFTMLCPVIAASVCRMCSSALAGPEGASA